MQSQSPSPTAPGFARDSSAALAIGLAVLAVAGFAHFFQSTYYGDAPLQLVAYRRGMPTGHRLHFYVTEAFGWLGLSPLAAIRAASYVPAGLAVGCLFAALVRAGLTRVPALLGVALFVATPSVLFFATTIEVHGLQLFGVAVAFFAAVSIARPAPSSSLAAALGWSAVAALALALTHPMNLGAGLGLVGLFLVGLRARGASRRATLAVAGSATLVLLLAALLASRGYLDRQGWSVGVLADAFRWRFDQAAPASHWPLPLDNLWQAVVRPAALLLAFGALGLVLETRGPRGWMAALGLWVLVPALLLLGPDFHERGAYFLVALPALALGAGYLASSHRLLLLLTGLCVVGQAGLAIEQRREFDRPPPPEAVEWLAGLSAVSAGRGVLLAENDQQQDWARRYLGMPADNLRLFLDLPEAELLAFGRTFRAWARGMADHGEPLFLPARVIDLAPVYPPLRKAVDLLRESFEFLPVAERGFQGYRGS